MFCPVCKAEYRSGFTVCSDCDVALVPNLTIADGESGDDPFCAFWKGDDPRVHAELCSVLDEAGVPYRTVRREDHLFNIAQQNALQIGVPFSLYEKAENAVKEAFGTDEETGADAVPILPPPALPEPRILLPEAEPGREERAPSGYLVPLWEGDDLALHTSLVEELKKAGIAYFDRALSNYPGVRRADPFPIQPMTRFGYQISVLSSDVAPAREILARLLNEEAEALSLPAAETPEDSAGPPFKAQTMEQPSLEIWAGEDATIAGFIEDALRENDILLRVENHGGEIKIYISPVHESRAREIIREVLEASPPE